MASGNVDADDRTVFVGNLDHRVTEELLWELFLQAGPLESVKIPKHFTTGKPKNFAFVVFEHHESVSYVKNLMNQLRLYGCPIRICSKNKPALGEQATNVNEQVSTIQEGPLPPVRHVTSSSAARHQPTIWQPMPLMTSPRPLSPPRLSWPGLVGMQDWKSDGCMSPPQRRVGSVMRRSFSPHSQNRMMFDKNLRSEPYHLRRRYCR